MTQKEMFTYTHAGGIAPTHFGLLWMGQNISMVGDWVLFVALPFYIYALTGSTLATGIMFVVQTPNSAAESRESRRLRLCLEAPLSYPSWPRQN